MHSNMQSNIPIYAQVHVKLTGLQALNKSSRERLMIALINISGRLDEKRQKMDIKGENWKPGAAQARNHIEHPIEVH